MSRQTHSSMNGVAREAPCRDGNASGSSKTKVLMSAVRQFARDVALLFEPERIILFGSHAYGTPHADSDVDILVVMPARNQIDQAVKIALQCDPPFPLDLIVRRPQDIADANSFLGEIVSKGKVLY